MIWKYIWGDKKETIWKCDKQKFEGVCSLMAIVVTQKNQTEVFVTRYIRVGDARGVVVIGVENGLSDPSLNPERSFFAFRIALIHSRKVCIQLLCLQQLSNSRVDWLFNLGLI